MASTLACEDKSPADLLKRYSVPYIEGAYHLYIGTVRSTQGWILHLSVLPSQLTTLLDVILPELLLCRAAFKVIRNKTVHYQLNAGHFGSTRIGKAITVYAEEGAAAATLAATLVALTDPSGRPGSAAWAASLIGAQAAPAFVGAQATAQPGIAWADSFRGPRVETDLELSLIVYARYGSFRPFRQADAQGYPDNYVYDGKGRLVRDLPVVPVRIPEGITPPFPQWTRGRPRIHAYRPVGKRYIPLRLMEDSYWGQTWKAIRLKGVLSGHHCLLLLGKKHILSDEAGLDIHDRFVYRQQLTATLHPHIPVPEIYDCFVENGDTYLAMENPGGRSLDRVCLSLLENRAWHTLPPRRKSRILGYLAQVAKILGKLDQLGYILPATETNHWGVTGQDKVYLDHLDTIYSPGVGAPYFGEAQSGSETLLVFPGARTLSGTFSELCIRALTGLHPAWIKQQDPERRRAWLETLLQDHVLVDALEEGDTERLGRVFSGMSREAGAGTAPGRGAGPKPAKPLPDLEDCLEQALTTLSQPTLAANRKWFSLPPSFEGLPEGVPPAQGAHQGGWPHLGYYNGLYQGTSGILCFLREAARCGFAVHTMEPLVRRGLIYLSTQSLNTINHNAPGLFTGSAGFAIGLCSALHSDPICKESYNHEAIRFCLEREATAGDILTGAAGQGMAVLHCAPFLEETFVRTKLRENAFLLLETQQKDGSWFRDGGSIRERERIYGFGRGIAGICYFLLEYGNRYHDAAPVQAAVRGLNYLVRVAVKSRLEGGYQWTAGSMTRKTGAGWFDGTPGIALAFLKAYEHLGTPGYRRIAEETLRMIPARYTSPNLSLYNGLSGLGEIYLEAARIVKDQEWQSRSAWIAQLLTEMVISDKTGSCYWHVLPPGRPTADLMVGNTGVMHFLLRYLHPEKVGLVVMGKQLS